MTAAARFQVGIDVGGTFTDFVLIDSRSGRLTRGKCLTTPADPMIGIVHGLRQIIAAGHLHASAIERIAHATTLVTNTLIERKGAVTGLITTTGFRDLVELGQDMRYDMYDLAIEFPAPLVERTHRLEIAERMSADGSALIRPSKADVLAQARKLSAEGVTSIAVALLHSYRDPRHEHFVERVLRRAFPAIAITASSTVAPEIREYERTLTAIANAYVMPVVRSYLQHFTASMAAEGVRAPILVMLSNGGMTTPKVAAEVPIRLLESGPAAGVLAACHAGVRMNELNLLAFDMGGTTAKACFIDRGKPAFTGTFEAARVKRQFRGSGMPLKVPSVEMIEIGAGGGSIARLAATGLLKVGPDSAGADPGPACYGRGGRAPTVTDADLLLGYLDPRHFLGGDMALDIAGAQAAIAALGRRCKLDVTATAAGIAQVVNQNMATAIRIHAAERGKDYRRFALFAFGGAGPVHAYEIARILHIPRVICPLGAGTNAAFGLLAAPISVDLSRSYNVPLAETDWVRLDALYRDMESEARRMLADAGVRAPRFERTADLRFVGQGFELQTPVPAGRFSARSNAPITQAFHDVYRTLYDAMPGALPIEAITWRLRASGPPPRIAARHASALRSRKRRGARNAWFAESSRYITTPVFDRYALAPGDKISGPAIIEERESTAIIGLHGRARVDVDFNLVIDIAHPGKARVPALRDKGVAP